MIRTTITASGSVAALALCAPVMAQPAIDALDTVRLADGTCAALENPAIPQSKKDEMRENIYVRMAGLDPATAPEGMRPMLEAFAIVRERGCGK